MEQNNCALSESIDAGKLSERESRKINKKRSKLYLKVRNETNNELLKKVSAKTHLPLPLGEICWSRKLLDPKRGRFTWPMTTPKERTTVAGNNSEPDFFFSFRYDNLRKFHDQEILFQGRFSKRICCTELAEWFRIKVLNVVLFWLYADFSSRWI